MAAGQSNLNGRPLAGPCRGLGRGARVLAAARADEGGDHAMERAQLLRGRVGALEEIAQVADHAGPLVLAAQEAAAVELLLEMAEEAQQLLLGRGGRVAGGE